MELKKKKDFKIKGEIINITNQVKGQSKKNLTKKMRQSNYNSRFLNYELKIR